MKLLLTSVGSLVGQNILDMIEGRREYFYIIGINSVPNNPRNFRCDRSYLTTTMSHEQQFEEEFIGILEKEKPDMILAGRDEDVLFLTRFKEKFTKYADMIPLGKSRVPAIMLDKYESYLFALENKLPFANSFFYRNSKDEKELRSFVKEIGFPIVVKPKIGFGSRGVFFIIDEEHLERILHEKDLLFQEFLGKKKSFEDYAEALKRGIPLYFDVEEETQCAGQTIISGNGKNGLVFCSVVGMVRGYPVTSIRIFDDEAEAIVKKCAKAMFNAGWYGFLNVQMKKNKKGHWKIFEFNPRMTGSTSARMLLGYDELGTYTDLFKPEFKVPNFTVSKKINGQVFRSMVDYLVLDSQVNELKKKRFWENKK